MRTGLVAVVLALGFAAPAEAAKVRVTPGTVGFGETLTIKGAGWTVFESCPRQVVLKIASDQNAFTIGQARVTRKGRFKTSYKIRRSVIGAGDWRMVAVQRCESGKDGSPNPIRRSAPFTVS